ncbi:MAG: filamentous hemagglutinin N-terminal domain-containing protein, partial [Proteobacteria bacterium]|nr:filamentous hemagglutinin N-terminal domain-containing protein [Pseudomonadota bacterium]
MTALVVASAMVPAGAPGRAVAQVVAATGGPQVKTADNGVQVVNIAPPNAQGLSVNEYTTYNVSSSGLILNNAAAGSGNAQGQVSTQLGGLINTNANLTTAAKAILNEVTSTNPTVLAGYTEVAGTRADVIVANPNGI